MRNKLFNKKIFLGIIFILTLILLYALGGNTLAYNNIFDKDDKVSFGVLGDIHHNTDKLNDATKQLYKINKGMDALILNGDIVDQGMQEYYDDVTNEIKNNKKYLPKNIIRNIGNHEFYNYEKGTNTDEESNDFLNRFLTFSEEKKPYHNKFINGYNFITLGSEETYTDLVGTASAYISKEQKDWLKEALEEKYEEGRPIFVFLHQGIGTNTKNQLIEEDKKESVKEVLSKYKEVIVFYSHFHQNIREVNVATVDGITTVHTGAIHYTAYFKNGKVDRLDKEESFGLYVDVEKNKVTIIGRDFKNKKEAFKYELN